MSTEVLDYKVQVSIKHGPGQSCMTNVRAQNPDELEELLVGLVAKGPDISAACEALGAVVTVSSAMPGTAYVGESPAQAADRTAMFCPSYGPNKGSHGQMQFREAKDGSWAGHFCPLGKDDPNRCKPQYLPKAK